MVQQATQLPLSGLWSFEKEDSVSWTFTILGLKPAVCSRWMPPGLSYSADEWAVACMGASLAIVCVFFHWNDNSHKWSPNWGRPLFGLGLKQLIVDVTIIQFFHLTSMCMCLRKKQTNCYIFTINNETTKCLAFTGKGISCNGSINSFLYVLRIFLDYGKKIDLLQCWHCTTSTFFFFK